VTTPFIVFFLNSVLARIAFSFYLQSFFIFQNPKV